MKENKKNIINNLLKYIYSAWKKKSTALGLILPNREPASEDEPLLLTDLQTL